MNQLLQSAGLNLGRIASQVGTGAVRSFLNAKWPSEFEYYMCSLELTDFSGNIVDVLIFPVMPTSIQEAQSTLVNIKKTSNVIVSITNSTFTPSTINISGTFGRKIRLLLTPNKPSESASAFRFSKKIGGNQINGYIKSGYGVTKVLERILKLAQTEGYLLFFYNLAMGNNYLVEVTDMSFQQAVENNMMWNYSFTLKSLAYAEDVNPRGKDATKNSIKEMLKYDNINKAIFSLQKSLSDTVKTVNNKLVKVST